MSYPESLVTLMIMAKQVINGIGHFIIDDCVYIQGEIGRSILQLFL